MASDYFICHVIFFISILYARKLHCWLFNSICIYQRDISFLQSAIFCLHLFCLKPCVPTATLTLTGKQHKNAILRDIFMVPTPEWVPPHTHKSNIEWCKCMLIGHSNNPVQHWQPPFLKTCIKCTFVPIKTSICYFGLTWEYLGYKVLTCHCWGAPPVASEAVKLFLDDKCCYTCRLGVLLNAIHTWKNK